MRRRGAKIGESQWCRGSTRVSGTLDPGSTPGWDDFYTNSHLGFHREEKETIVVFVPTARFFVKMLIRTNGLIRVENLAQNTVLNIDRLLVIK